MIQKDEIICPVCKSVCGNTPINTYTSEDAAELFAPLKRDPDRHSRMKSCIENLWKGKESFFIVCSRCGFGFGYPHTGGDDAFYNIMHESRGYPSWKWDYSFGLAALSEFKSKKIIILDIGAGEGLFLEKIPSDWNKYALEGSPVTRELLIKKGFNVISWAEMDAYENHFDAISAFQVLEHIAEFQSLLGSVFKMLKEDGKLIVSVPSCEAMILQEKLLGCPDMPPNHINKFTPDSLQIVLKEHGFKIFQIIMEPFSLRNIVNVLHLKIMALSRTNSCVNFFYTIKNRSLRHIGMSFISSLVIFLLLPKIKSLTTKGSFLIVAGK